MCSMFRSGGNLILRWGLLASPLASGSIMWAARRHTRARMLQALFFLETGPFPAPLGFSVDALTQRSGFSCMASDAQHWTRTVGYESFS